MELQAHGFLGKLAGYFITEDELRFFWQTDNCALYDSQHMVDLENFQKELASLTAFSSQKDFAHFNEGLTKHQYWDSDDSRSFSCLYHVAPDTILFVRLFAGERCNNMEAQAFDREQFETRVQERRVTQASEDQMRLSHPVAIEYVSHNIEQATGNYMPTPDELNDLRHFLRYQLENMDRGLMELYPQPDSVFRIIHRAMPELSEQDGRVAGQVVLWGTSSLTDHELDLFKSFYEREMYLGWGAWLEQQDMELPGWNTLRVHMWTDDWQLTHFENLVTEPCLEQ